MIRRSLIILPKHPTPTKHALLLALDAKKWCNRRKLSRRGHKMAVDVFISYAIADKLTADAACAALESAGIRCWIAPRDVLPGMDYAEAIIEALEKCRGMLLIFSSNANRSNQVKREVERAVHHGIPIIPFRIEDVPPARALEYYISSPHWLDALTPPLEQHLKQLSSTIQILLDRASGHSSQAPTGRREETRANRTPRPVSVPSGQTPSPSGTTHGTGGGAPQTGFPVHSGAVPGVPAPAKPKTPVTVIVTIAVLAFLVIGLVCFGLVAAYVVSQGLKKEHVVVQTPAPTPFSPPPKPRATETSSPTDLTSALAAGQAHETQGDYQAALNDYTIAIQFDANNPDSYSKRGNCYKNLEQYQQALNDYNTAIRLRPDNPDYYNDRGIVYWKAKQYDNAIADYNQALHLNGNVSRAYNNRGLAYYDKGNVQQALGDYEASMRADPQYADPYYNRGLLRYYGKEYDPAISDFSATIELEQRYANAYYMRALCYQTLGNYKKAISDYSYAIDINDNFLDAYNNRGLCYDDLKDVDHAMADYNEAIRRNPSYMLAYYNRGIAFSEKGKPEDAINDFNEAIRLNPNYGRAYYNRAMAYQKIGQGDKAKADFAEARRLGVTGPNSGTK